MNIIVLQTFENPVPAFAAMLCCFELLAVWLQGIAVVHVTG